MFPKFSLIVGAAVAALVLAAPAGAVYPTLDGGDSGYADRNAGSRVAAAPDFWNYDASGQKVADTSPGVASGDLAELHAGSGGTAESSAQRAVAITSRTAGDGSNAKIGVAAGIALLLGLLLAVRHPRIRPLAH